LDKGLGVLSVLAFASAALLWMYYGVTLPTVPDSTAGRTWPLNYRGRVVYLVDCQLIILIALFGVSGIGFIAFTLIEAIVDPYLRRRGP
jgi:hypothetical protein